MTKSNQSGSTTGNTGPQHPESRLLDGEMVSFSTDTVTPTATDEQLNIRYAKGEIRIVTESARYPLAGILRMLQDKVPGDGGVLEPRYMLDPEYQRRHRWNTERKSRLIESFLMNVPVPPVFLYERDLARFEVMDGRQRLTTLSDFYADRFKLTGLEYWPELNDRTYSQLPSKVRDGIDRRYISSIILLKETAGSEDEAAKLKKVVFERLNSGGVELGGHETRNAVYDGPLNKLCLDLSENITFKKMWGIPLDLSNPEQSDDEDDAELTEQSSKAGQKLFESMEDVELVLRFFAYRQIHSFRPGLNKIGDLLDQFLAKGNLFSTSVLTEYRAMFDSTVEFLWATLETESFCTIGSSKSPKKFVYDPMMYVASSDEVIAHRQELLSHKQVLRDELGAMYRNEKALFSGRRTNLRDTLTKNKKMGEAFTAAIARAKAS